MLWGEIARSFAAMPAACAYSDTSIPTARVVSPVPLRSPSRVNSAPLSPNLRPVAARYSNTEPATSSRTGTGRLFPPLPRTARTVPPSPAVTSRTSRPTTSAARNPPPSITVSIARSLRRRSVLRGLPVGVCALSTASRMRTTSTSERTENGRSASAGGMVRFSRHLSDGMLCHPCVPA